MHIKNSLPRLNFIFFIHFWSYFINMNTKNKNKIYVHIIHFTQLIIQEIERNSWRILQNILGLVTAWSILMVFHENDGSYKYLENLERTRKISQDAFTGSSQNERLAISFSTWILLKLDKGSWLIRRGKSLGSILIQVKKMAWKAMRKSLVTVTVTGQKCYQRFTMIYLYLWSFWLYSFFYSTWIFPLFKKKEL